MLVTTASSTLAATISTELINPDTTITFNEIILATNTPLLANYQSLGVTFDGVFYDPAQGAGTLSGDLINGFSGHSVGNFTSFQGGHVQDFGIQFVNDVDAFSIRLLSNTQFTRFEAFLNGGLVETVDVVTNGAFSLTSEAFGFTSIIFDEVRIRSTATGAAQTFRFDTLRFNDASSVIPIPAAICLFGSGIAALMFRRRVR